MLRERVLCPAALAVGLLASIALAVEIAGCDGAGTPSPAGVGSPPRMLYMSQARSDPRRTHYVSPAGSDRGPGTVRRPWQRLDRAVRRLGPGSTLILQPGTYGAPGGTTTIQARGTRARPITLTAAPGGRRVRIKGLVRVSGSHLRLLRLLFEGPTGAVRRPSPDNPRGEEVPLAIYGNDVTIAASEIRGSAWHAGIYLDGVKGARIVANYIHDNGDRSDPAQANLDHGIYWSSGSGVVANNVVTRNLARGDPALSERDARRGDPQHDRPQRTRGCATRRECLAQRDHEQHHRRQRRRRHFALTCSPASGTEARAICSGGTAAMRTVPSPRAWS